MHSRIREILRKKLLKAIESAESDDFTFGHCRKIASKIDCDANSVARLFGLGKFKQTQKLTPDIEQKISSFLQYEDFETMEYALMLELIIGDLKEFQMKNYGTKNPHTKR
jgi:hypothetical protein